MSRNASNGSDGRESPRRRGRHSFGTRLLVGAIALVASAGLAGCSQQAMIEETPSVRESTTTSAESLPDNAVTAPPHQLLATHVEEPPGATGDSSSVAASTPAVVSEPVAGPPVPPGGPAPVVAIEPPAATSLPDLVAPSPIPMSAATPVRIEIPSIGVDSGLLTLGLQEDGTMQVPPDGDLAGWYDGAPTPGEMGPAIIVGHVDWAGDLGVFYYLRNLEAGNSIVVTRADGSTAEFRVATVEQFSKDNFPTDTVYGDIDHPGLRLVTCGGSFDRAARSYVDNIVVFADLV